MDNVQLEATAHVFDQLYRLNTLVEAVGASAEAAASAAEAAADAAASALLFDAHIGTMAVVITSPAVGAEFVVTVPVGKRWELHALSFLLVTSAQTGQRNGDVLIDDGANVFYGWLGGITNTGNNQTVRFAFHVDHDFHLQAGYRIRSVTNLLRPGDQFSAIALLVTEHDA